MAYKITFTGGGDDIPPCLVEKSVIVPRYIHENGTLYYYVDGVEQGICFEDIISIDTLGGVR
jgi:hypothetical protein